jgi:hypothetical protein
MKLKSLFKEVKLKTLLSTDILEKKYNIKRRYLMIPLVFIIFFFINPKYFVYGLLTVVSGLFSFYHDKYNKTPIDLKMPLFLGIMISREYGFFLALIFFILSDTIPSLLGGGRIEGTTLIFIAWFLTMYALVGVFPTANIITFGIILVIVEFIGSLFIKMFFGIPGFVAVASSILSVLVRMIYFLTLGGIINFLFTLI